MGILDSIIGGLAGGGSVGSSPLRPILAAILGGLEQSGPQGASAPGLGGLLERFTQAGHGGAAGSWVGNGPNEPISPDALHQVFGQEQVSQWSQQTGMAPQDLLHQLSEFLPHAVNQMTPNGEVPQSADSAGSAFDGPGVP